MAYNTEAQKRATQRWASRNREKLYEYKRSYQGRTTSPEYFREYYHKNKQQIKFRNECLRLKKSCLNKK